MSNKADWISSAAVLQLLMPLQTDSSLGLKPGMSKYKEYLIGSKEVTIYNIVAPDGEHFTKDISDLEKTYAQYELQSKSKYVYWFKGQEKIFVEFFNNKQKQ